MYILEKGCVTYCRHMKGVPFFVAGKCKGYLFCQNWYMKGSGFGTRRGASPFRTLLSNYTSVNIIDCNENWKTKQIR